MKRTIQLTLLATLITGSAVALSDDDDGRGLFGRWFGDSRQDVAPVANPSYRNECGSCHFAYPPGLLPTASWEKLMSGLSGHFGDNAELDPATHRELLDYLRDNSADRAAEPRARAFATAGQGEIPLRISDTLYFKRKHHEIPQRLVEGNPKVGSFSRCELCHQQAERGSFNEHEVVIPGAGRWDD